VDGFWHQRRSKCLGNILRRLFIHLSQSLKRLLVGSFISQTTASESRR